MSLSSLGASLFGAFMVGSLPWPPCQTPPPPHSLAQDPPAMTRYVDHLFPAARLTRCCCIGPHALPHNRRREGDSSNRPRQGGR
eukprot:CAMPEP_0182907352 /NCGR_PEP_ID=MMETSP0034_2-20130328/34428_1 /TAXON_ID=156128 /ORGANISM="Nephroselmis pyriformis, Strain CCMP717" /LENGTH=83 /DNA_ID=CAMNT_0025043259 /DNA_START=26 /DNA_END=273 /DNA_ORIENTATION=+